MLTAPAFAVAPLLRVDGVPHHLGDAAVLRQREAFAGTLPWSLEVAGPAAERLLRAAPAVTSGRPGAAVAARLLESLRPLLLRAGPGRPRFALLTVERVEVGPSRVRLVGTCAPMLPTVPSASAPAV
jgi:hypothetical protein